MRTLTRAELLPAVQREKAELWAEGIALTRSIQQLTDDCVKLFLPEAIKLSKARLGWWLRKYRDEHEAISRIGIGCWKAIDTYDPDRCKLQTWLVNVIKFELRSGLKDELPTVTGDGQRDPLAWVADTAPDFLEEDYAVMEANARARWNLPAWRAVELLRIQSEPNEPKAKIEPVARPTMF